MDTAQTPKSISTSKKDVKRSNIIQFAAGLIIIVLLNIIGYYIFTRFDLTSEKRYTLSPATKKLIKELDDVLYIKVYLKGDYPSEFKKLENETKEMLSEFRAYNKNIEYEFIDPNESPNSKDRNQLYRQLMESGLQPTDLQVRTKGGESRMIIFPGALVTYKGKTTALSLLENQIGINREYVINNSINSLEYNISNTIRKLTIENKPKVGFLMGHGELDNTQVAGAWYALAEYYNVERVSIDEKIFSLTEREQDSKDSTKYHIKNKYDALIIAKPETAFSEKDKFILDQYIMYGGRVMWLIDPVMADMDSLANTSTMPAIGRDLNLNDQLFTYGVRLNSNLVMDLNAVPIKIQTGMMNNTPQISMLPWYYFPVLLPTSSHVIVNHLNAIKTEFTSSLDTIANNIQKTILLSSSNYSRAVNVPVIVDLTIAGKKPDKRLFKQHFLPIAVLLEGEFTSAYDGRMPYGIASSEIIGYKKQSKPTKMIVVADGDIIKNQFNRKQGFPLPLGFDQDLGETFGNEEFILNCMNYLCDESGLISVRSRETRIRVLDQAQINEDKFIYQIINIAVPIISIALLGIILMIIRKKRFAQ